MSKLKCLSQAAFSSYLRIILLESCRRQTL